MVAPNTGASAEGQPQRAALTPVNLALAAVALLLAVVLVLLLLGGSALGLKTRDQRDKDSIDAVTKAAYAEAQAMLTVDYKRMDPLITRVLHGATGAFARQYRHNMVQLKAAAQAEHVRSTARIRALGVSDVSSSSALVFVAADGRVSNTATQGKSVPRYWRVQMRLTNVGSRWLVSDLRFVGSTQ